MMIYTTYSCGHAQKDWLYDTGRHGKVIDDSFNNVDPMSFKYVKFVNDDLFVRLFAVWLLKNCKAKFTAVVIRCALFRVVYIAWDTISLFVHTYRVRIPEKNVPRDEHFSDNFSMLSPLWVAFVPLVALFTYAFNVTTLLHTHIINILINIYCIILLLSICLCYIKLS